MNPHLLIIDDDDSIRAVLREYFQSRYEVTLAASGSEARSAMEESFPSAVLLDLVLPDANGIELLRDIKDKSPDLPVVMLTAHGDIDTAVKAMSIGADHFLAKPLDLAALAAVVSRLVKTARIKKSCQAIQDRFEGMKEQLVLTHELQKAVEVMAANPDTTVLITGPTGSGKGVLAELIHYQSVRAEAPFLDVNCAGLTDQLLESELMGHEQGAFTDAKQAKRGLLEIADGGTLFLDEIGEMPLSVQAKILKVIETKTFRRLGGTTNFKVDVRIVAATKADIKEKMARGDFREDLYYRLNVLPIHMPPLSERPKDISKMADMFLQEFALRMNKRLAGYDDEARVLLANHEWPGNIRELRNVVERASILCNSGVVTSDHLPADLKNGSASPECGAAETRTVKTLKETERDQIMLALRHTGNNKTRAARLLGIGISTLARKVKEYGINGS